jgi:hypothetical protein
VHCYINLPVKDILSIHIFQAFVKYNTLFDAGLRRHYFAILQAAGRIKAAAASFSASPIRKGSSPAWMAR